MLYLFDLDDTLIRGYLSEPRQPYDVVELLPGRKAKLQRLILQGDTCCIVTNQGGVAFGFVTEDQADAKITEAMMRLGLMPPRWDGGARPALLFACYHHEKGKPPWDDPVSALRRKPSGQMILEAIEEHPQAAALGVLMVGDREEDLQAAQAAGVPFQWAHVFFGI